MPKPLRPELRWLFRTIRPQLHRHVASFFCLTLASFAALITPLSIRWLIDSILPSHSFHLLVVAIVFIFASYEGRAIFNALGGYLTFQASQRAALNLRMSLLRHLDSLSPDYYDRTPVGEMLYPFSGPIDAISYFGSDLLPSILRAIVATGMTISAMTVLSPPLTLAIAPIVPVFLIIRHHYRRRITREADVVQSDQAKFSGFLQEHLSALTQLQLLLEIDAQEETAHRLLIKSLHSQSRLCRTGVSFSALSNFVIVAGIVVILTCGSVMVFKDKLTIGTLVAFYSLLVQLFDPLSMAMEMYSRAQRTFSCIRQIQTVFEITAAVKEHVHSRPLASDLPLDFAFKDVSFAYHHRRDVIRIQRLAILQGERVAVVGPNGAGKSTLGKLLARLYDVELGAIFIGGSDIRVVALTSLRSSVCYLPTQPVLFHRSVADNLRIGKPESTCDELEQVLCTVGLTKYLNSHSGSLQEYVEPGGSNLSSGERQRIAIARALLLRPRVLILDETTSSLDPTSEQAILQMIDQTLPDSTLIVVSHRVHSITWMKRILLMQNGQIVGDGNHSALCATNRSYARFLASSMSVR